MKRTLASSIAVLAVLSLASVAGAQSDCTKIVPVSPWGPNDQTGATNRITAAVTKAAAAEIQSGKVVTMTYPLVDGCPAVREPLHQDHPDGDRARAGRGAG
jgi:hypothetical protein